MRKVFISYARENKRDVDQLVEHLGLLGYETWFDSSLRGGQDWWNEILRRITECDVFVAVVSRQGLDSTACRHEFDWADALGKPVLPVAVEPVETTALPRRFAIRQIVDYSDPGLRDRAAVRLAGSLTALPSTPPLPESLPEPPETPLSYLTGLVDLIADRNALNHEQQRQILLQLEPALSSVDSQERRSGREILDRFSRRDDLYADVDRTIARLRTGFDVRDEPEVQQPTPDPGRRESPDQSLVERQRSSSSTASTRRAFAGRPPREPGSEPLAYTAWITRALSWIIDLIPVPIVIEIGVGLQASTRHKYCSTPDYCNNNPTFLGQLALAVAIITAAVYLIWNFGYRQGRTGASVGKSVLKFKVVDETTGQPIGFGRSVLRLIAHIVDVMPCYIGYLFPLFNTKRQTFADKLAATICVPI